MNRYRKPASSKPAGAYNLIVAARFRELRQLVPALRLKMTVMIILGILTGFSEMVGITFLVSLVFLLGQQGPVSGSAVAWLPAFFGGIDLSLSKPVLIGILIGSILFRIFLGFVNSLISSTVSHQINDSMRERLYAKVLTIPFQRFQNYERSDLINVIVTESYAASSAHASLVRLGVNFGTIVIFGAGMLVMAWPIALLALGFGFIHNFALGSFAGPYRRLGASALAAVEALTQLSWTTLQTLKAVKSFGLEKRHQQLFETLSNDVGHTWRRSDWMGATTSLLSEILTFGVILTIILSSQFLPVDFKAALSATILLYRLQPHIKGFDSQILRLYEMEASLQNVLSLLSEKDDVKQASQGQPVTRLVEAIAFHDVSFIYEHANTPAVRNLSFSIRAGETTALTGPSGSGKTTILNMILDLSRPTQGKVTVDGRDLANIDRTSWLQLLSVSGQDVELMEGTVLDNIRFRRDIPEEDIRWAADVACATEFIENLPEGFDEWLGDEAVRLSGGQRQRIGLARALAGRPQILLLDEATSALDEHTEMRVLSAMKEDPGRTLIVVSHRPAVARLMKNQIDLRPLPPPSTSTSRLG
ncbi:ATP-binding cassette subfamily B protein/subfamily B ATP-binding cassette protein MsbA [Rhizobium leguminosarum]|uniref:ATP-binding cassette subfamily B protein/subfamily B ATP-binding cassette protein MsbA n=1 Tax=Rhizobium leguminosarum TaxID=384 RepID=A0AAE2MKY9_RHILE|nr:MULTISPECIES: ABC transporter ATP-binding protein [Rhizobium]MBB4290990.1 ATP-binding cassette subfamily B protein/subfamily B ATP-binding cassette protein MsbA [Rhizobium leguminosarum]MBB4297914.1 ATP-binding cassette subfamily B protein/subfamily B ATP-binding cassette protein MsbA [Rhizobium leguminosarum]MBB4309053.1 ATP-binding cassette subfamily B protein/subfamily B ATP-binding cassette protein MsbA [Rhizobium leguminosarum]MBB4416890.1 ATP-binding cassette subfamily B protein/subfam